MKEADNLVMKEADNLVMKEADNCVMKEDNLNIKVSEECTPEQSSRSGFNEKR